MIGGWELIVVLIVVLVLFGGKKLPELARNLGKGMREFKRAAGGIAEEPEVIEQPCEDPCSHCGNTSKSCEKRSSGSE